MKTLKLLDQALCSAENGTSAICFTLMSLITLAGVFFRYVVKSPIIWAEELSRYLMIWGVFIGISIVTRKKAQLGVDIFVSMAPPKIKKALALLSHLLLTLTYTIVFYLSCRFTMDAAKTGQLTPILRIPFFWVYLSLPVGFCLSTIRSLQILIKEYLLGQKDGGDGDEEVFI